MLLGEDIVVELSLTGNHVPAREELIGSALLSRCPSYHELIIAI